MRRLLLHSFALLAVAITVLGDDGHVRSPLAFSSLVAELVAEGLEAKRTQALAHYEPDAVARFAFDLESDASAAKLAGAMLKPAHRDPFIDSYVRWQLTSFHQTPAKLDDAAFIELLAEAPPMIANPLADPQFVAVCERADEAGSLREEDLRRLNELWDSQVELARTAESLNRPAVGFRDWIAEQIAAENATRQMQALLERCSATIRAGWTTRIVKGDITKLATAIAGDAAIRDADRAMLARQASQLVGLEQRIVSGITFLADGSVNVSFTRATVDANDVQKWIDRMTGGK